jgi:hypothetical protein
MRFRPATILWLSTVGLALLAGCGSPTPPPPAEAPSPPPTTGSEPAPTDGATAPEPRPSIFVQPLGFEKPVDPGYETVQRYMKQFYDDDLEALQARFSAELKQEIPLERLREMREAVRRELGDEVEVIAEDHQTHEDYRGYARRVRFSKHDGVIEIQWILHPDDSIAGFVIKEVDAPEN